MSITDTMYYYLPKFNQRTLQGDEAGHFLSTRVKEGDELDVCDQKGSIGKIIIEKVDKKKKLIQYSLQSYEVLGKKPNEKILFQAIPDKQYLDKLVELLPLADIDRLILFESQYSPKYNINWERLKKILIRSTEQCQRLWQPEIELVDNKQLQKLLNENSPLVLDCTGEYRENFIAKSIIVGPEGGWSEEEIEKFKNLNLGICKISELVLPAWIAGYTYLT